MRPKKSILGIIAIGIGVTSALTAYGTTMYQTTYYVRVGPAIRQITLGTGFNGCFGTGNTCRVRLTSPGGTVLTEATTVYANSTGTTAYSSSVPLAGTVIVQ